MQPSAHRRLSQSVELSARALSGAGRCRDGQSRSHQAALLRQPPQRQSDRDRSDRPADRFHLAARSRALRLNAKPPRLKPGTAELLSRGERLPAVGEAVAGAVNVGVRIGRVAVAVVVAGAIGIQATEPADTESTPETVVTEMAATPITAAGPMSAAIHSDSAPGEAANRRMRAGKAAAQMSATATAKMAAAEATTMAAATTTVAERQGAARHRRGAKRHRCSERENLLTHESSPCQDRPAHDPATFARRIGCRRAAALRPNDAE